MNFGFEQKKAENLSFIFLEIKPYEKLNAEEYVKLTFNNLGFEVRRTSHETGIPDFIMEKDNEKTFIEVKTNGDGLRSEQIEWIISHPREKVIIFFLKQKILKREHQKIHKERIKKEIKLEELRKLSNEAKDI